MMPGTGTRVGRFHLVRVLGSGGFGTVWEAVDSGGVPVAVKLLDRMGAEASVVREQLLAEAAALQSVDSPHTLRVVDVIDDADVLALVTDLVPGVSLRSVLDEHETLSAQDALVVLHGAAQGLAAVHAAGLVHGDVKPANMLVEADGNSRLIDFGLAALPGWVGEDALSPWGSPAYAPPEQVAHDYRDHRSDIYSLTVTLFEVLCGQRPFTGDTVDELRLNHVHQPLPDPRLFVPDLGDGLTQLILWGLAKDPAQRPQDVATWLQYLEAAAEAKYGPGWAVPAGVGAVAGGLLAGGLVASGVLAPATGSTAVAAATGAAAGGAGAAGAGAAGGSAAGAGAESSGAAAGTGGAAAGSGGAGAAGSVATGGFLSTVVGKVAVCAGGVILLGGGGFVVADQLGGPDPAPTPVVTEATVEYMEKIVLTTWDDAGQTSVAIADPDGSNQVELAGGSSGALSPDGRTVAFVTPDYGVATVPVTGGEPRTAVTAGDSAFATAVEWADGGASLVYGWTAGATAHKVLKIASNSSGISAGDGELVVGGGPGLTVSLGADGALVYADVLDRSFVNNQIVDRTALFVVEPSGGEPQQVAGSDDAVSPAWSPDGTSIAYIRETFDPVDGLSAHLRVMSSDGTGDRAISDRDFGQGMPQIVWSPDGRKVAVAAGNGYPRSTSLVDLASGELTPLIDAEVTDWGRVPVDVDVSADEPATAAWSEERTFDPPLVFDGTGTMRSGDHRDVVEMPADWKTLVRWNGTNCPPENFRVRLEKYHPDGFVMGGYDCSDPFDAAWAIWSNRSGHWEEVAGGNGSFDCPTLEEVLQWTPPTDWNACV